MRGAQWKGRQDGGEGGRTQLPGASRSCVSTSRPQLEMSARPMERAFSEPRVNMFQI